MDNEIEKQFIEQAIAESLKDNLIKQNLSLREQQDKEFQECLLLDRLKEEERIREIEYKKKKEEERIQKIFRFKNEPNGDDTVCILFRYSQNSIIRKFYLYDTIKTLYDFISITDICPDTEYNFTTPSPRKLIEKSNLTLQELEITGKIVIVIEPV